MSDSEKISALRQDHDRLREEAESLRQRAEHLRQTGERKSKIALLLSQARTKDGLAEQKLASITELTQFKLF